jgi:CxxC motif-containing protein
MTKRLTCIECPKGCTLSVDIENCRVVKISGNECPKGEKYAVSEIESPLRVLTSSVLAEGLALKMVPVRTTHPIPKAKIPDAMNEIKKIRIRKNVRQGETLMKDFMGLGVDLVATRGT